jgi:hypothetical protein
VSSPSSHPSRYAEHEWNGDQMNSNKVTEIGYGAMGLSMLILLLSLYTPKTPHIFFFIIYIFAK